ncbi:MAG: hypothetical protein PHF56_14950 [Desulfuromonadaceae bacterium]|nr:hypothetical protein [Desulfuromonadaceae bacterium]
MEGDEFVVSRVILLNDGLMALATIPNEYFEELMKNKATADIIISAGPGVVVARIGPVAVMLPSPVFEHLAEKGKMFVYLSDYDNYVMAPWLEGTVNPADLWSAKGISDYLLATNQGQQKNEGTFQQTVCL